MIVTSAAIIAFLTSLATKGLEKAVETTGEKVSEGSVSWIRSLFYKGDKPKKALEELQREPGNPEKLLAAKAILENSIEDNPEFSKYLHEIISKAGSNSNTITNSKNINTGTINSAGGDIQIGDRYESK